MRERVELERKHHGRALLIDALGELGVQHTDPTDRALVADDSRGTARAQRRMPAGLEPKFLGGTRAP